MRGICGIVLEEDKAFLSFSGLKKKSFIFFREKQISLSVSDDFIRRLKINAAAIDEAISSFEKENSLGVDQIFIELPAGLLQEKEIAERIVLAKRKRIRPADIEAGKKYIENKFLEWDERCLHHLILDYQTEGIKYESPPLGLLTDKLKLNSLLFYIKDNLYKEAADIFYNLERNFAGFVAHKLSSFSQGFKRIQKNQILISVNNDKTYTQIRDEKGRIKEESSGFSIAGIIDQLSSQYAVTPALAEELLERYGTFKVIPYFKEVSVKKDDSYLNISVKALADFLKKIFSEQSKGILEKVLKADSLNEEKATFSFIGPLSVKEGFYGYVKDLLPYRLEVPTYKCRSSSLGCARYGALRPLEEIHRRDISFLGKLKKIYREYF